MYKLNVTSKGRTGTPGKAAIGTALGVAATTLSKSKSGMHSLGLDDALSSWDCWNSDMHQRRLVPSVMKGIWLPWDSWTVQFPPATGGGNGLTTPRHSNMASPLPQIFDGRESCQTILLNHRVLTLDQLLLEINQNNMFV